MIIQFPKTGLQNSKQKKWSSYLKAFGAALYQVYSIEFKEVLSARVIELIKDQDLILDEAWEATRAPLTNPEKCV